TILFLRSGGYFKQQDAYFVEIDQSELEDLRQGASVLMLGQRIGEVKELGYVGDSRRVRIELAINPRYSRQIFDTSTITPDQKYGLGSPNLVIKRNADPDTVSVPLPPGSTIVRFEVREDQISEVASEVKAVSESILKIQQRLDPALASIDAAADSVNSTFQNRVDPATDETRAAAKEFSQTNRDLRPLASETLAMIQDATLDLQKRVGELTQRIDSLVENDIRETLADIRASADRINTAAGSVGTTSESIGENANDINRRVAESLESLVSAAESVQRLSEETRDVVRIVRQEANDLPGTTNRVNDTVSDTQDLVDEIRGHWLLRRTSKRDQPASLLSPSNVRAGGGR
ncbi:MAG: MlaD family protein, partial [Planctomycetota bacterium]